MDPEIVGKITGVASTTTTVPVTTTTSLPTTSKNVTVVQEIAVNISSIR